MKDKEFRKLTKTEKLKMEVNHNSRLMPVEGIGRILFIPVRRKMDGWSMSAMFVQCKKGWVRLPDYDCFRFMSTKRLNYLKGDFEYGGVCFFAEGKCTYDGCGGFSIKDE